MEVILTGATGFVGRHLHQALLESNYSVSVIGRDDLFPRGKYDILINCAGEINKVNNSMFRSNVGYVNWLLNNARESDINKFIQIGSSSEYGGAFLMREDMQCMPCGFYGATKLAATDLCLGYAKEYDMDICVARPFSLYGERDTSRKLIPRLLASRDPGRRMNVFDGAHDWVYIKDFVRGIGKLMRQPKNKTQGDIINFGTGKSISNLEVAHTVEKVVGKIHYSYYEPEYEDAIGGSRWFADTRKARSKYKWVTNFSLEEGLKDFTKVLT